MVQVQVGGSEWIQVCQVQVGLFDSVITPLNAATTGRVVCRQLGYAEDSSSAFQFSQGGYTETNTAPKEPAVGFAIAILSCVGTETNIRDCPMMISPNYISGRLAGCMGGLAVRWVHTYCM